MLKDNAKRRDKVFTITIEEYTELVQRTKYLELRANGEDVTWDRIKEEKGYEFSNMQVLPRAKNVSKMHKEKRTWNKRCEKGPDDPF
jgi:hypothetical protein